jgi:Glyoxalase-like domain
VPRLRQAVLAARELNPTVGRLQRDLGLGQPYHDPGVGHFGLANAVFALGDTFLEVVSPIDPANPAARTAVRQLDRSGRDLCGYMVMLQVEDLGAARRRARAAGVREVFEVALDDIAEVHLHPADMRGAIVSLSVPVPPDSWRWGGENWSERAIPGRLSGVAIATADPEAVSERWTTVAGGPLPECRFVRDEQSPGLLEVQLELDGERRAIRPGDG